MDAKLEYLESEGMYPRVVLEGILGAREKVRVATATLKNLHADTGKKKLESAVRFLFDLARRGVSIEVLHGAPPSGPFQAELRDAWPPPEGRLRLRLCPRVHFKAVVVDYIALYVGSANFTGAGLGAKSPRRRNFEIGFWTESPDLLDRVNMLFDRIWSGEACNDCGRRNVCPVPLEEYAP
jgi:phosphatidylserine/phosphatidylglycerophosphate/cardiolipin synthase-like enzyme